MCTVLVVVGWLLRDESFKFRQQFGDQTLVPHSCNCSAVELVLDRVECYQFDSWSALRVVSSQCTQTLCTVHENTIMMQLCHLTI